MGETRPSAPGRSRKVSPGRAKGDSPDQGQDLTTPTEGDTIIIMPFSEKMTHRTTPEPTCHVCRAGPTSADRSGIRTGASSGRPFASANESR